MRVVVLFSGRGSNLQALLDAAREPCSLFQVVAAITNQPGAAGLERAVAVGVPTAVVDHRAYPERGPFEQALSRQIDAFAPDLVALAGFMRILGNDFVAHYAGRMLNIHPSLLPRYRGLDTHRRALEAGDREHGVSIHFVTGELDGGPLILQQRVAIRPDDREKTLAARVLEQEHRVYPAVIRRFAEGRISLREGQVWMDGKPLGQPRSLENL